MIVYHQVIYVCIELFLRTVWCIKLEKFQVNKLVNTDTMIHKGHLRIKIFE